MGGDVGSGYWNLFLRPCLQPAAHYLWSPWGTFVLEVKYNQSQKEYQCRAGDPLLSPSSRLKRVVSLVAAANWAGSELTALVAVGGNKGADPGLKAVFTALERRCTVNAIAVSKKGCKGGVCRITATANISQTAHVWGLNTAVRMFFLEQQRRL